MQPIREYGGDAYFTKMYDIKGARPELAAKYGNTTPGDGILYCGKGYVQLTWKVNYARAEKELGVPLIQNPGLAMDPEIAAKIMIRGMQEGWFTGVGLNDFVPGDDATRDHFKKARKIINGTDKDDEIADIALVFQNALHIGEWK